MEGTEQQTSQDIDLKPIDDDFFANQQESLEDEFLESLAGVETKSETQEVTKEEGASTEDGSEEFKFDETLTERENKELEELNKRFNTSYETLEEFNKAVTQKEDTVSEDEQLYQKNVNEIAETNKFLQMGAKDLMREQLVVNAIELGKDVNSETVKDEIQLQIEEWEEKDTLDLRAQTLKDRLRFNLKEKESFNKNYKQTIESTQKQQENARRESIQNVVSKAFKEDNGMFMGIKTEKKDYLDAYQNITKEKLVNHIKNNPGVALQVELFLKYQKVIARKTGGPTYSDGLKDTYNALSGKAVGAKSNTKTSESSNRNTGSSSLVADFTK